MPECNVRLLLGEARLGGIERRDALAIVGHALGRTPTWLISHDDAVVNEIGTATVRELLNRRMLGEPLAYLLESQAFNGLMLRVTPDVLIPRPDTETLVDWAVSLLDGPLAHLPAPSVIDLGTGSGAIALAVKHRCPRACVTAFDMSTPALDVAKANAAELGLTVSFEQSNWWAAAGQRRFDLALSNPPYIAEGDSHLAALRHEPIEALVSGADGMTDLRKVAMAAAAHLYDGGWLLLEHGYDQGPRVRDLLSAAGCVDVETRRDPDGNERCTGGRTSLREKLTVDPL
ncbi:peptide chain release factor N(5)-glutamine methyltransferase [soil metagenome]